MHNRETVRALLVAKPGAVETFPFDMVTLVVKVEGKMFALLALDETPSRLTLKCDPEHSEFLRAAYPTIQPGYHMDKRHWITFAIDGALDPALIQSLIDESYRLVVAGLSRAARARLAGSAV
jgi:predicted DNA-binding protein (MmcQ/YjbR family)